MWTNEQANAALYLFSDEIGVSVESIRGRDRRMRIVSARQTAAWMLRRAGGLGMRRIGSMLHRDNTTVSVSVRRVDDALCAAMSGTRTGLKESDRDALSAIRKSLIVVPPDSGLPLAASFRGRARCR